VALSGIDFRPAAGDLCALGSERSEQGRSLLELTAAVDPALYPVLSVTAEPGDGNPGRTGPEVLRSR
jgi:hypothetical protein